ncbi:MAG: RecX family transcriptional regulator [Chitinophagaceae bacterium]|nr:RecX family transcriptional regulator [Chitinophagaceae bacterium]
MIQRKVLTREQAFQMIRHYCAYQERCHSEVKEKLYGFGLHRNEVDGLLSELIENNYLNEERFACQYAGGKFRINQWGRNKIVYALRQKGVSTYCINKGLKEIKEADYDRVLLKLATAKWSSLKSEQYLTRQAKAFAYLQQKGFEPNLISAAIKRLKEK